MKTFNLMSRSESPAPNGLYSYPKTDIQPKESQSEIHWVLAEFSLRQE
ncbi:MAG: hypothetical protein AAFP76_05120 [Bacteroidota bacterium]